MQQLLLLLAAIVASSRASSLHQFVLITSLLHRIVSAITQFAASNGLEESGKVAGGVLFVSSVGSFAADDRALLEELFAHREYNA